MMLRVTGEVVRYQKNAWNMDGRSGVAKTARVLVGRADFADVRVPEQTPDPREGDWVDWAVEVDTAYNKLRVTHAGEYQAVVGSSATPVGLHAASWDSAVAGA